MWISRLVWIGTCAALACGKAESTSTTDPSAGDSLGLNATLAPRRLFPADNPWNQPVDTAQVDPDSDRAEPAVLRVGEQRLLRHRVDRVGRSESLDVQGVRGVRVLRPRARPQQPPQVR